MPEALLHRTTSASDTTRIPTPESHGGPPYPGNLALHPPLGGTPTGTVGERRRNETVMAEADVIEVEVRLEGAGDGEPIIDELNGRLYCRLSWARGAGPPACRGIYVWTSDDYAVLYIGKATSDRTSHLYRRITAYKRASPGKTQWTSLRLNSEILRFVQSGGRVRLVCLAMPNATADDVTRAEIRLIDQ